MGSPVQVPLQRRHSYFAWLVVVLALACSLALGGPQLCACHDLSPSGQQQAASRPVAQPMAPIHVLFDAAKRDPSINATQEAESRLLTLLARQGPDMRPSRDYQDFSDISLQDSALAWRQLHRRAKDLAVAQADAIAPVIHLLLLEARVTEQCRTAVRVTLEGVRRFEAWAVKMINSWPQFPPVDVFEGTYSSPGAYDTCVNAIRPGQSSEIGHTHYCSITFRPVMPSRRDYELVIRKSPDPLLHLFNPNKPDNNTNSATGDDQGLTQDAFSVLLEHAHYHNYVYYKMGTCWPIVCTPFDVRRVVMLVAKRNSVLAGPVKCYSTRWGAYDALMATTNSSAESSNKTVTSSDQINSTTSQSDLERPLRISVWNLNDGIYIWQPHFSKAHKVSAAVVIVSLLFVLIMTFIDISYNLLPTTVGRLRAILDHRPLPTSDSHESPACPTPVKPKFELVKLDTSHSDTPNQPPAGSAVMGSLAPEDANGEGAQATAVPPTTSRPVVNGLSNGRRHMQDNKRRRTGIMSYVADFSLYNNTVHFFTVTENQMKNEIVCLNGIRCITMVWIIMTHTMMYNDWSAFSRTREIEKSLKSLIHQPLFNGSYLVDTFFLMSGLLSAFTAFRHCQGLRSKFNSFAYIMGRWLRLTPQIFLVSMMYIALPTISHGPHWFPLVGEYSENCVDNWWINVLHMQSFYKKDKMCNFVTWWISIDFFYHFLALAVIWIILLNGHKRGFLAIASLVVVQVGWQAKRHYELALPPNMLSTIPSTGTMWTIMTIEFFWTPYAHAVPFFMGFYTGYLMSQKRKLILRFLNPRVAIVGWLLSSSLLTLQSYSTYWWVTGAADYPRLGATIFYTVCALIWSTSLCWVIIACHHGYGGLLNRFLSCKIFIVLGKASYLVYLSHFQIMFLFFGNLRILLEPTELVMFYVILGNIVVSTMYGVVLCIVFEMPWLRLHRRLMELF